MKGLHRKGRKGRKGRKLSPQRTQSREAEDTMKESFLMTGDEGPSPQRSRRAQRKKAFTAERAENAEQGSRRYHEGIIFDDRLRFQDRQGFLHQTCTPLKGHIEFTSHLR